MFSCILTDFQSVLAHVNGRHPGSMAYMVINSGIFSGQIEVGAGGGVGGQCVQSVWYISTLCAYKWEA